MRTLRIPAALAAVLALVAFTAWLMAWPLEKAVYLAPVIVVGGAAAVGLVILWGKVAAQSLRESRRPRLVLALWLAGLALLVLLTCSASSCPARDSSFGAVPARPVGRSRGCCGFVSTRRFRTMNEPQRIRVALAAFTGAVATAVVLAGPVVAHGAGPGTWCGGTLWRLMTLSDPGRSSVAWSPAQTAIADIAKLASPARTPTKRSTPFQRRVWQLTAVIDRYRIASNGEIVLVLYDIGSSTYMNAYLPNPKCLSKQTRGRAQILAARKTFTTSCQPATKQWQFLGATARLTGVGYWNPVRTTKGALPNGAELRPLTGFEPLQGCGKY